jgi:ActR/RegA family two-component response regulator
MSLSKTILIAHQTAQIRDRVAAALADARHDYVTADSADAALSAVGDEARPISLAVIDLGLAPDAGVFVGALKRRTTRNIPVVIFAGSVRSAADVPALLAAGVSGYLNEHAATAQIVPALAPHLFPDSFDRRSSPRVTLGIPVSYRAGSTIAGALTLNVGKGGVGIRTMSPIAAGSDVQIKFRLPSGVVDIEATGRVAWSNRQVGFGIQFDRVAGDGQAAIDAFVDANT